MISCYHAHTRVHIYEERGSDLPGMAEEPDSQQTCIDLSVYLLRTCSSDLL